MLERLRGFITDRGRRAERHWPCGPGSTVESDYGWQKNPLKPDDKDARRFHTGIDIKCAGGLLLACEPGYVIWRAENHPIWGNVVGIEWQSGYFSTYSHMASKPDRIGKEYVALEVVGKQGNTGLSLSAHLHFQVMTKWIVKADTSEPRFGNFDPSVGKHIDPRKWLPKEIV
jgi:murein DD-endopeptidase MepM/ murein hydrolase activator NlpD